MKYVAIAASFLATALAIVVVLTVTGHIPLHSNGPPSEERLPKANVPPLEYAYLDPARVDAYMGEATNGITTSEQRTKQLTRAINASLSAGAAVQAGASQQEEEGTMDTVEPKATDRMYEFLRLIREKGEVRYPGGCNGSSNPRHWIGNVDDQLPAADVEAEVSCIGVGNFVRIDHVQLFVPPFAQALQRAQSATAFYGALPAPRHAFTSPTQSTKVRSALHQYAKLVGSDPRMPFVAAPFGGRRRVGNGVTFFLPMSYDDLTVEPSLLSSSVTIVGKIIYSADAGAAYVDYPTVATFGRALLRSQPAFRSELGVCSKTPPPSTHPQYVAALHHTGACESAQQMLSHVTQSVTFKPPFVVVLPLAIYE
jgi:hypothetical protein